MILYVPIRARIPPRTLALPEISTISIEVWYIAGAAEALTTALPRTAKTLEQNINTVVELSMNNGVSTENLLLLNESIQKGLKTYKEGIKRIQNKNQNEKTALDKLNASLNGYNQEIAELTSNNEEDVVKKLTFNNNK